MPIDKQTALKQIDDVLAEWAQVQQRMDQRSGTEEYLERAIITRMRALITRLAPPGSGYTAILRNQYGNYYDEMLDFAGAV